MALLDNPGQRSSKPLRKRKVVRRKPPAPPARLQAQVDRELRKVRRGDGPTVDTGQITTTAERRTVKRDQERKAKVRRAKARDRDGIAGAIDDVGRAAEGAVRAVYGGPAREGRPGTGRAAAAQTRSIGPSNTAIMGAGRVVGHTAGAIGESVYRNPVQSTKKAAKQAGEIAKGVASTAIGLPVYAANYNVNSALGRDPKGDEPGKIAKRIVNAEGKRISKTYGPSYRGEKGSYRKLEKQLEREGPLVAALDLATVAAPASLAAGATTRGVTAARAARGAAPGRTGRLVNRPPVRVTPLGEATSRAPRRGLAGQVASATTDAVRRKAQRTATKRAVERRRVKAVRRVTGRNIARDVPGRKASVVNTQPKAMATRRVMLKPGEVTPISPLGVGRKLRVSTATIVGRGESAAKRRTARYVTDTSKGSQSVRASFKDLPEGLHHAAITAAQLGIKDAGPGARTMLDARIREIESTVAAARASKKHPDRKAAMRDDAHLAELARLRAYRNDPSVFARAEVQRAADGVRASPIGPREGLSDERAAGGRVDLVGGTLGLPKAKEVNAAARVQRKRVQAQIKVTRNADAARHAKEITAAERRLSEAKVAHAAAVGRAQILTRNVTGQERVPNFGYAGGSRAVKQAEAEVRAARSDLKAARTVALDVRKAHRAALAAIPKSAKVNESNVAYAARVDAAAAAKGLAPPAHVRSAFKRDDEGLLPVSSPAVAGQANPLSRDRKGTLYRTGREDKSLGAIEDTRTKALRRGARLEARSQVIAQHGKSFPTEKAANAWAAQHGITLGPDSDMILVPLSEFGGMAAKGLVSPRLTKAGKVDPKADAGNYVKSADVILLPKKVRNELRDLDEFARTPPSKIKSVLAGSQAAILALNPAWWQFQRVNDLVAATVGESITETVGLEALRRQLKRADPDAAEIMEIMAGGSMSREMLTPHSAQKLGRIRQILDANPTYRDALRSDTPATALLLRAGKNLPTMLLRSDAAITGAFRERQLLHNLRQVARKMDPNVRTITRAFDPIGLAFKTGDVQAISRLLKDPAYQRQLGDAVERLDTVMGDWHTYTARELNTKQYAAFYGFLRYSTRMALFTLPLNHPAFGLLVARLGEMGAQDAKAIVGPDMPWGLGTLYNADGTIAADFARSNPLTGPLLSIERPEQFVSLATPLASLALSLALGQSVGLSNSAEGYVKQFTSRGDLQDKEIGFLSAERGRIGLANLLRMLGPISEWQRFDQRIQTSDSLPWDRRIATEAPGSPAAGRLAAKNANRIGGLEGLLHNTLPLVFPGSERNVATQGRSMTDAEGERRDKRRNRKIRRAGGSTSTSRPSKTGFVRAPSAGSGFVSTPSGGSGFVE